MSSIVSAVNREEKRQVVRQEDIRKRWLSMEICQFLKLCVCVCAWVQYILSCPGLRLLAAGMNIRDAKVDNMCV